MSISTTKRLSARQGLTLLELVIVLAILAALAGLVLPLAGTYLTKAHAGAASDNFKEISKVVQQYQTVTRLYPDQLDSLLEDTATGTVFTEIPGATGGDLSATTITANIFTSLTEAGITSYCEHNTSSDSSTFASTDPPAAFIVTTDSVATVDAGAVLAELGVGDGSGTYAIFGFGHETNIIGDWIQEAPYHFPEEGNPNTSYNRFGLVFDITDAPEAARFVGVVSFHEDGVVGISEPLAEFFEN